MKNKQSAIRLIYPQWQGGIVSHWMPDIPANDSSRGYYLGARLLNMLAPETSQKIVEVPVSMDISERKVENGIMDYKVIMEQTKAAFDILLENDPDRIITFGGDCSVSVAPFAYLAKKYDNDVALVWIDAHPDINLPGDEYAGYHAMALTALMGMVDYKLTKMLPRKYEPSKVLIVGLRAWEGREDRQKELKIKHLTPKDVSENSFAVLEWIKATGASKVVVHFDLDVIEPNDMVAGVGVEPNGMKIDETVRVINDIASNYEVVGLTIAEPMPRIAIKIRNMLDRLSLLK